MRSLIAILLLVLVSGSAADSAGTTVSEIDLQLSAIAHGAVIAFPFTDLPEGWTQGGLVGVSGLSNPSIGSAPGGFTIPAGEFLVSDPATISWSWSGGGPPLLSVTYYICATTPCRRPKVKFLFKTKAVVLGVRG